MPPPPLELLSPTEMGRADHMAVTLGASVSAIMEQAGRAVARAIRRHIPPCRTIVLCGPGNNGGDGYVTARHLAQWGWPVSVAAMAPPHGDAIPAAARWRGPRVAFAATEVSRADLVIDALFGGGLTRDIAPDIADVLRAARRLVAIDTPSGVDGASGAVRGFAPRAELTVTFFRAKPGHLLLPGRDLCGALMLADIGMPSAVLGAITSTTFRNAPGLWSLPTLADTGHKYSRGHVTVLGGPGMTGAARLAAEAARRGGAGLVTIAALGSADVYRAGAAGVIVDTTTIEHQIQDVRRTVWVCGPGLGADDARRALPVLLAAGRHVVVDADALTLCAGAPERLRGAAVLTPHEGEFTRVFGPAGSDRLAAARAAARLTDAVVVLKGSDSIIASPDGRAAINNSAPPSLATAGSGDVLSGLIAGLLAQGMAAWEAACAAVWLHGQAADIVGPGLLAEDLPPAFAGAFARAFGVSAR
jgi:hydroxyethylthiazole kinase-like uncharacterized protein yjeF